LNSQLRFLIIIVLTLLINAAFFRASLAQPDEVAALNTKVSELYRVGKYAEAVPFAQRSLAITEKTFGRNHASVAVPLSNLATLYRHQGRYADAEPLCKRSLAIREKALGPNHPDVASSLSSLADIYQYQSRYADAEPLYKRALAIREKALDPDQLEVAVTLNNLGGMYVAQGRYADAEPLFLRSLAMSEKMMGPDHLAIAGPLDGLANLYQHQGRYADAEPLAQRSLAIKEKTLGPDHLDVDGSLNLLANVYQHQGRYADVEPLLQRSLTIREKALGPDHLDVATALYNLALLYQQLGRFADAEPLVQRSLTIREKAIGTNQPIVADSLNLLAFLYQMKERYAEAELLYQRSLAIKELTLGRTHPGVGAALNNLALLYKDQGRYAEAESLYKQAIAIDEKRHGPGAGSLNNLAFLYQLQGRYADAEPLYKKSMAIYEKAYGPGHPRVAEMLNNLAHLYQDQGRYADAEPLLQRSLDISEKGPGPNHPNVTATLNNLADLYLAQGRTADALPLTERAIALGRASPAIALPVLYSAQRENLIPAERAMNASLDVVQRLNQTSAAAAVGKLAVRLAAGDDQLAHLVRKDQDLAGEAETLNTAILAEVSKETSKRDTAAEQRIRDRLAAVATERASLQKTFAVEFPNYAALSNPLPLTTASIQSLLSDDEALVAFAADGDKTSYVFALTRDGFDWKQIQLGTDVLPQKVNAFRAGLNVDQIDNTMSTSGMANPFDLGLANELYVSLFGPVEALIKDKKQLLVAPSGTLTALPFHLLVTEKPVANVPAKLADYRDAAWLIKRQAVAVLPSVASLKTLRAFGLKNQANKPMIGFGDPIFNPAGGSRDGSRNVTKSAARNLNTGPYTEYWQGAAIDRSKLALGLSQLPDTAVELTSIAQKIGAPASDIHLGQGANETAVKRAVLSDYRIVYFATHALVAGDVKGLAEPSIVLSIPSRPSDLDDGLLTASEVAQLKLNADWVVLSACNTIAGNKPGAEALSGLARSFFYAGARALLVSHWAVDSAAATRLTTSTFEILKSDPNLSRAEALRQAMLGYLNDESSPQNAYPALWGPFALIGEGAAR
jgi:CHAT domain-containing protein/tetratricopeptide (TPR) repeat protein